MPACQLAEGLRRPWAHNEGRTARSYVWQRACPRGPSARRRRRAAPPAAGPHNPHNPHPRSQVAEMTWAETFKYLADNNVLFEGILLKPSMVTPGAEHAKRSTPDEVRPAST